MIHYRGINPGPLPRPATNRIAARFARLRAEGRAGLVPFISAGDPDSATSAEILAGLPAAGADLIEIGMPFSDPMADGPAIQASSQRALRAGASLRQTIALVRDFRQKDADTPLILMGYYNPIYVYGVDRFLDDAIAAGVDGLIVVDLPPEEDGELCLPAQRSGLPFIRLATPTTDEARIPKVLAHTEGFLYYVSVAGITGTATAAVGEVKAAIARLRAHTDLPIAIGFGITTPDQAASFARIGDAVVVGSSVVRKVAEQLDGQGRAGPDLVATVLSHVRELAKGVRGARRGEASAVGGAA
jgi:tryptophan synthase alpha chain